MRKNFLVKSRVDLCPAPKENLLVVCDGGVFLLELSEDVGGHLVQRDALEVDELFERLLMNKLGKGRFSEATHAIEEHDQELVFFYRAFLGVRARFIHR